MLAAHAELLERQRRRAEQLRLIEGLVDPKEFLTALQFKRYELILKFFEHFANDHYSLTKPINANPEEIMRTLMGHFRTYLIKNPTFLKCFDMIFVHINFKCIPDFWLLDLHKSLNFNKTKAALKESTNEKRELNKVVPAEAYTKLLTICHDRLRRQIGDQCCNQEKEHERKMKVLRTMR